MKIKDIIICALFVAITAILSQIVIQIQPIPISLSVLAVYLCGAILKPKFAFISQVVYILLGIIGAPVFAGFRGGLSVIAGPTGGYLAAYPLMALIISFMMNLSEKKCRDKQVILRMFWVILSLLLSIITCYLLGASWFSFISKTTLLKSFKLTVYPFVVFDLIKIVIASFIILPIYNRVNKLRQ